jgi:asparagine synthase (glutamine-hydrolysing)
MCGFVTFFSKNTITTNHKKVLDLMLSSINHRGPDAEGTYYNKDIYLGFRRLSIVDIDNGSQPFSYDNDNYQLVFNGEIYNYIELREDLIAKGYTFSTKSEAEVILTLYNHYGEDFVKQLRGMFSFVIWDKSTQTLFAARDSFGIKPLFYIENEHGLYCASEAKSLLYSEDINAEVNSQSLCDYLTFQFVPEPSTMFKDIYLLESGSILIKQKNKKLKIKKFSSLKFSPELSSRENRKSEIKDVLEKSVEIHMRSDVPVGTFLSGGIDSSIITALARKVNPNLKTFTVGFEVDGYSEIGLAQQTANELGVENISISVSPQEFIKELPNIIWHMDNPLADPSSIPLYFICKEASKHVKVILSGEGADELFGGYNIYHEPASLKMFSYIPNVLKKILKSGAFFIPENVRGKSFIERGCTPIEERYFGNAKIFSEKEKEHIIRNHINYLSSQRITKPLFEQSSELDDVSKMQYIDINTWLKGDILTKADRMSMAHSLELRVPFLDKEVFKVASKLILKDKINNKTTKYLLREAFKEELPACIVNRKKLGYPVPIRNWLKTDLYDWAADLINEDVIEEFIDKKLILTMLEKHRNGKVDYSRKLWTILTFILWKKIFI